MKRILVLSMILFTMGCTTSKQTEKFSKKITKQNKTTEYWSMEVEDLNINATAAKTVLEWKISDKSNVKEIQIMRKFLNGGGYRKIKTISPENNSITIEEKSLSSLFYKVRLVSSDGKRSKGKNIRADIPHKNVIRDEYEGREMLIYLPDSYNNSDKKYPVVYFHDGQNLFSEFTGSPEEWKVDEILDELVAKDMVEEMIVVGIYHGEQRAKDYVPYKDSYVGEDKPGAKDFSKFVVNGIIPYIDWKYRTIANRENRAVMGSSFGGILSLWMGYNYSDVFSTVGAVSPSLWVANNEMAREISNTEKPELKIWMDRGTLEYGPFVREALEILISKGFEYDKDVFYHEVYYGEHNEFSWSQIVASPLILFKGKEAKKALDIVINIQVVADYSGNIYTIINPVVTMDNGMKYSAVRSAKYEVINQEDGKITEDGLLEFKNKNDLKVRVTAYGIEKEVFVKYEDILEKTKKLKKRS